MEEWARIFETVNRHVRKSKRTQKKDSGKQPTGANAGKSMRTQKGDEK